jgi:hypothetical protein
MSSFHNDLYCRIDNCDALIIKMADDTAIVVRKACKHYGSNGIIRRYYPSNEKKVILDDLNMTVPKGSM